MFLEHTRMCTKEMGPRPAGLPTECFYCHVPLGAEHTPKCVIRSRTVVIRQTIEYTIVVPEHWTRANIVFQYNESSWCASNALVDLDLLFNTEGNPCMCNASEIAYVREADEIETEQYLQGQSRLGTRSIATGHHETED